MKKGLGKHRRAGGFAVSTRLSHQGPVEIVAAGTGEGDGSGKTAAELFRRDAVQRSFAAYAEDAAGDQDLVRILPLQLPDQILSGQKTRDGDGFAEKL